MLVGSLFSPITLVFGGFPYLWTGMKSLISLHNYKPPIGDVRGILGEYFIMIFWFYVSTMVCTYLCTSTRSSFVPFSFQIFCMLGRSYPCTYHICFFLPFWIRSASFSWFSETIHNKNETKEHLEHGSSTDNRDRWVPYSRHSRVGDVSFIFTSTYCLCLYCKRLVT